MNPTVCCVMLVNGREQMVERALSSFFAQTYEHKHLLVYDTSEDELDELDELVYDISEDELITVLESNAINHHGNRKTIGYLRNRANAASRDFDLIAHFDSDDWSNSRRLEEQVALLEASGKQCVGYRELLFWDTRDVHERPNQAWIYRNPGSGLCAGATLLYRRQLWEQCPFADAPHEDRRWWSDNPAVSSGYLDASAIVWNRQDPPEPRMICEIHAGSTENIPRQVMLDGGGVWKRAPEFDVYCARKMQCA